MHSKHEIQEERENRNKELVKKALASRCKHNMIFEYCAMCNEVKYHKTVCFPIEITDRDTNKPKRIFIKREVERVYYHRYR